MQQQPPQFFGVVELPNSTWAKQWDAIRFPGDQRQYLENWTTLIGSPGFDPSLWGIFPLLLLVGPTGTGKTITSRGVANALAEKWLRRTNIKRPRALIVHAASFLSNQLGNSQKLVQDALEQVQWSIRQGFPTVLLADEFESIAFSRTTAMAKQGEPLDSLKSVNEILNQFDTLMETRQANGGPLLFASVMTSNLEAALDPAVVSRAALTIKFGLPNVEQRFLILGDAFNRTCRLTGFQTSDTTLHFLAERTEGLAGRTLVKLPFLAALEGAGTRSLTWDDIEKVVGRLREQANAG